MASSESKTSSQGILSNRYRIISELDKGSTAQVFKVKDEPTDEIKVAKIFNDNERTLFKEETHIYEMIDRLHLETNIRFYKSSVGDLSLNGTVSKKMYIILEYGSKGSLFDALVKTKNGFTENVCKYILLNLLNGVEALHKAGICHRDLKPENIVFVGDNYDIKIIDFGLSAKFVDENNQKIKLDNFCGTPHYCPPEINEKKSYDGTKVDIFTLGVMLFIMRFKQFGFATAKLEKDTKKVRDLLYTLIIEKDYDRYWELLKKHSNIKNLSPQFKNLYLKMVAYNPDERLTIEEIKQDEFMANIINASEEEMEFLRRQMINEIEYDQQ
jgi:serine/threonine protein kinase